MLCVGGFEPGARPRHWLIGAFDGACRGGACSVRAMRFPASMRTTLYSERLEALRRGAGSGAAGFSSRHEIPSYASASINSGSLQRI